MKGRQNFGPGRAPLHLATAFFVIASLGSCTPLDAGVELPRHLMLAIDLAAMDQSQAPNDNFYRYVNGRWLATTEVPAEQSSFGTFNIVAARADRRVQLLLDEKRARPADQLDSDDRKIRDLSLSVTGKDWALAGDVGEVAEEIGIIRQVRDAAGFWRAAGLLDGRGVIGPLKLVVRPSFVDSRRYVISIEQHGLSFPHRRYYIRGGPNREAYLAYAAHALSWLDMASAGDMAERLWSFEARLAALFRSPAADRDRHLIDNEMTAEVYQARWPNIDWQAYLARIPASHRGLMNIRQPDYVDATQDLVSETPSEVLQAYLALRLFGIFGRYLGGDTYAAWFDFNLRSLHGASAPPDLVDRGVNLVDAIMGDAVGREYKRIFFDDQTRIAAGRLAANIKAAFRHRLMQNSWLSEPTRRRALGKLDRMRIRMGGASEVVDYSDLKIDPDNLIDNLRRGFAFLRANEVMLLDGPVDVERWPFAPQETNAFHAASQNRVFVPAGILISPIFDAAADPAINYGALGAMIGHELVHAFDDQGRKFNEDGVLADWWSEADIREFTRRSEAIRMQYEGQFPLPGQALDTQLTLGENIADIAGLAIAFDAYQAMLGGNKPPVIQGFTGEQRFFMSWAQVWRRTYREEDILRRLVTDPHALSEYRVNIPMSNQRAFLDAFGVRENDAMFRDARSRETIW